MHRGRPRGRGARLGRIWALKREDYAPRCHSRDTLDDPSFSVGHSKRKQRAGIPAGTTSVGVLNFFELHAVSHSMQWQTRHFAAAKSVCVYVPEAQHLAAGTPTWRSLPGPVTAAGGWLVSLSGVQASACIPSSWCHSICSPPPGTASWLWGSTALCWRPQIDHLVPVLYERLSTEDVVVCMPLLTTCDGQTAQD